MFLSSEIPFVLCFVLLLDATLSWAWLPLAVKFGSTNFFLDPYLIPSDFTLSSTKPRLLVINFIFCRPLLFELILNSHQIHVKHGTSYSVRNFPLWSNFFSILFYHSLCKASIVACRRLIVLTARSFNFATRTSRNSFRSIYQYFAPHSDHSDDDRHLALDAYKLCPLRCGWISVH